MRRWISVMLCCWVGAFAAAAREVKEFKPPHEMTPEELEASKARSRTNVNKYDLQVTEKVQPIPWKAIGFFVLSLSISAPFALRYYRETAGAARKAGRKPPARVEETRIQPNKISRPSGEE